MPTAGDAPDVPRSGGPCEDKGCLDAGQGANTATSGASDSGCDDGAAACGTSQPTATIPNPAPLPKGTTVLHIGDSMAGALGITLNDELKKHGVRSVLRFKTASFIPTWAWSKELPVYLAQYNPDLVVITLGTNEVQIRQPETRIKVIQKLVARLGGRPCVWILPPLWEAGDTGLLPVIQAHAAPCRVMNTAQVFPEMPRLNDKIHPTIPARADWSKRVVEWLGRERDPNGEKPWSFRAATAK